MLKKLPNYLVSIPHAFSMILDLTSFGIKNRQFGVIPLKRDCIEPFDRPVLSAVEVLRMTYIFEKVYNEFTV